MHDHDLNLFLFLFPLVYASALVSTLVMRKHMISYTKWNHQMANQTKSEKAIIAEDVWSTNSELDHKQHCELTEKLLIFKLLLIWKPEQDIVHNAIGDMLSSLNYRQNTAVSPQTTAL